jgi:hypothetical protein
MGLQIYIGLLNSSSGKFMTIEEMLNITEPEVHIKRYKTSANPGGDN